MSNEPLTHDELDRARHSIDYRTGKPAIDNPVFRHDLFHAQVQRQAADEAAAAARPPVQPHEDSLRLLADAQAFRDPTTGVRLFERNQGMREAVEALRADAFAGRPVPPEVVQQFENMKREMADEAAAKRVADEQAELARYRKQRDGY